ncbi:unnamed protein product [Linum tenue]|nr:unnamed protein product [Linum tenue]
MERKIVPKHESLARSFDEEIRKKNSGLLYIEINGEVVGYAMYSWLSSLSASITKLYPPQHSRRNSSGREQPEKRKIKKKEKKKKKRKKKGKKARGPVRVPTQLTSYPRQQLRPLQFVTSAAQYFAATSILLRKTRPLKPKSPARY